MESGRWSRIEELFHDVAHLAPEERAAFLDRECGEDRELRFEVESLFSAERHGGLLDAVITRAVEELPGEPAENSTKIGCRIGRYVITALIGKGGMGAVYLASREDDFRMQVAIKLLKCGADMDTALARFRKERQILARLQHPNIAHLIDGGTTESGLPYLVMEYVDGKPLLEYAAGLPVRRRLELFRSVCQAVQFAHENLIVHRDIKPSNILVADGEIPKLLDFGIAKVLDPTSEILKRTLTLAGHVMTPSYASPEQVRGEAVTTATDIYSLGAVLYELLTGRPVHSLETYSMEEIQKEICTREPPRPSSLVKGLNRDLDNILLKALSKEPERRYASAAQLSEDLDRYLRDLPVEASGAGLFYRGRKFCKRNRPLILAGISGAVIAFALISPLRRFETRPAAVLGSNLAASHKQAPTGRWDHLRFEKIATIGDPAPGGGFLSKAFEPWALNNRGDITFAAGLSPGGQGVFLVKAVDRSVSAVARAGQALPDGGILDRGPLGYTSINDSGEIVFSFGLRPFLPSDLRGFANAGLYRSTLARRDLTALVIPGVTPAPGFGVFRSTGMHAAVNNAGTIVLTGIVSTTAGSSPASGLGSGIFLADRNAHITKVVVPGDPAPGGGKFDFAQNPSINDSSDVAYGGHLAGEECISIQIIGPGCAESVYVKRADRVSFDSIAHQGEQVPGGSLLRWAWGPLINNRDDVIFMGEVAPPPGLGTARGIYFHSRGATVSVAFPGDAMPDGRRINTVNPSGGIGNYSLNNFGEIGFNASLANGDSGLYIRSEGVFHLIAGTGTVIPDIGTVSDVAHEVVNGAILNDNGQVLFGATLMGGKKVLLLATPARSMNVKQ